MKILIERLNDNGFQTTGILNVIDNGICIFQCLTLELSWKDNKQNISCIPTGKYECSILDYSPHIHYQHIWIKQVPNRGGIKIHVGNKYTDIRGCILVGDRWKDIDGDGVKDVLNSRITLEAMLNILPTNKDEDIDIEIVNV